MKTIIANGKPVRDDATKVCLLFDPNDGQVIHAHGVTVVSGDKAIDAFEVEARARRHAEGLGKATSGLKVLHVSLDAIRRNRNPRVPNADGLVPSSPIETRNRVRGRTRQTN